MKIVIENHIPYITQRFERVGCDVAYLPPEAIDSQAVADADALIIRTRTCCDESLLAGSRCRFVGTATIGTDHIDLDYCRRHGITVASAPGCNAPAVGQYVLATIGHWAKSRNINAKGLTLGIVGVGHVGSIVARFARQCGLRILLCDPPLQERMAQGESPIEPWLAKEEFTTMQHLAAEADIVTFHTPLTHDGAHPTFHLCGAQWLAQLQHCRLIINSARGPITDTEALLQHLDNHPETDVAIDCWEGEPHISQALLHRAFVATPHIAGYSQEGKIRGTAMVIEAFNRHYGLRVSALWPPATYPLRGASRPTLEQIMATYNPADADTKAMKGNNLDGSPEQELARRFESLRDTYPLRHAVPETR